MKYWFAFVQRKNCRQRSSGRTGKLQEHFGEGACHIIRENPFPFCEIKEFAFLPVDLIAMKAKKFRPDHPMCIKAAIPHVMQKAEGIIEETVTYFG
ncbi:MAG: hypothetical protein HFH15_14195 [Ruminococcus sp.]|jgi:exodeoxyribonuclease V alpha subunit|nr:hypothetical protein [Ruminococcus sp.]